MCYEILECQLEISPWVEILVTCACFVKKYDVQVTAIATLLDLIDIVRKSQFTYNYKGTDQSTSILTVKIYLLASISFGTLGFIGKSSLLYEVILFVILYFYVTT